MALIPIRVDTQPLPTSTTPIYVGATGNDTTAVSGASFSTVPTVLDRGGELGAGTGVSGASGSGVGVYGSSQTGFAGKFDGYVVVNGPAALTALSIQKSGVPAAPVAQGNVSVNGLIEANELSVSGPTILNFLSVQKPGIPSPPIVDGDVVVGGTISVAGDVVLTGADFAEDFAVEASPIVEPGAVMVLDENGVLRPCDKAYDRKVAGVVSGAGDHRPGLILDRQKSSEGRRLPVALVGKVYCKIDAQYGPIEVGDRLTTSPTPGHAMKATDASAAFGAVLGKALRSLKSGQEMIPILVALQ
jgi:hypothetical protein